MSLETQFTPVSAAIGGVLIGLAAVVLMGLLGRIAGISGILGAVVRAPGRGAGWQWAFLVGLVLAAFLTNVLLTQWAPGGGIVPREGFPVLALIAAGLLVGFGTAMGSGCTSGHGVCGLSRLSTRSLVATVVFMVAGVLTATVLRATFFA